MIKNPRNLLWLIPLILFVSSPVWKPLVAEFLAPRSAFNEEGTIADKGSSSQQFVMDSVVIVLSTNGKKEWRITSRQARTGENDHDIEMEGVEAVYLGTEKPPTEVTSRRGRYLIDDRHLMLIDDVVINKPQTREVMNTDLLHYYDKTKMAVSPGKVRLTTPNIRLEGGRMDYDLSTDGFDFTDRVKVDL